MPIADIDRWRKTAQSSHQQVKRSVTTEFTSGAFINRRAKGELTPFPRLPYYV